MVVAGILRRGWRGHGDHRLLPRQCAPQRQALRRADVQLHIHPAPIGGPHVLEITQRIVELARDLSGCALLPIGEARLEQGVQFVPRASSQPSLIEGARSITRGGIR